MTDEQKALIVRKDSAIESKSAGSKLILHRMVSDAVALAISKNSSLSAVRFKIGEYEFNEPDYRLIVGWAELLDLSPEEVVGRLERSSSAYGWNGECGSFEVKDGSIMSLVIDFEFLPIKNVVCGKGLLIRELFFIENIYGPAIITLDLALLNVLSCAGIDLVELDLSNVPALTELWCDHNKLTELDLSNVPSLYFVNCESNQLTELDLTNVPALTNLYCQNNQLTELDLSNVPALTTLVCYSNQLFELDLSRVPALDRRYTQIFSLEL